MMAYSISADDGPYGEGLIESTRNEFGLIGIDDHGGD